MLSELDEVYDKRKDNTDDYIVDKPTDIVENEVDKEVTDSCKNIRRDNDHPQQQYSMVMGDKPISFFERMVDLIFRHGIFKSVGAFLLIMACVMVWQFINALNYDKVAEKVLTELVEKQNQEKIDAKNAHLRGTALRIENNGKIQKVLLRLLYDTGADRASILEMHNGKENPSSLPFIYCDMTYEETKGKVAYVSDEYEQLNMGKYPFFTHLIEERIIFCNVQDIKDYDKKFYNKLALNDTKYIAMLTIKNELDVGFLVVSFIDEPNIEQHQLLIKLNDCAQELGILLDLSQDDDNA